MLFVNSFILFMKREFKIEKSTDLELRIDDNVTENELTKIKPNDLFKNLFDIYYQKENYYILYVDLELHSIKKKPMDPKETEEKIININIEPKFKPNKRQKKLSLPNKKNEISSKDSIEECKEKNEIIITNEEYKVKNINNQEENLQKEN